MPPNRSLVPVAMLCAALLLGGCASIANKASQRLADSLTAGILEQDDIGIARDGIPSWLLLVDGLIQGDPRNSGLLLAGSKLYGAYAGGFVDDPQRAQRLAARSFDYARRATCIAAPGLCAQLDAPFESFASELAKSGDVAVLHALASAWAGRIQANSGDWNAIAAIPKVQALLERVIALEPAHAQGEPHMMLGVLASLRPASLGGQPEQGKAHFEKALALSGGRNQMVRVLYAQYYARLVFDQALHDRLLGEAIVADPHAPGLTLINVIAQDRARALLASGKEYF
jgi:hypothetical protein